MTSDADIRRIVCDNPSAMTLEGTNTYVLGADGVADVVIVDPGPEGHPEHLDAVLDAVGSRRVSQILVTHRHRDHTGAAALFAERAGAPVRGFDAEQCWDPHGSEPASLADGEEISAGGLKLIVRHTPGHTSDSVCFWLPEQRAMLTGDTILGKGTTMLDFPDATLTQYLETLRNLAAYGAATVLPAHGPELPSLEEAADRYIRHRQQRLEQMSQLLEDHGPDLSEERAAELLYGERSGLPRGVVLKIVGAQLDHLRR